MMVVNSFSFVARRTPWESFVKVVIMVMVRRLPLCVAALSTHMVVTVAVDRVMVSAFIQQTTVAAIPHRHHLKKYKQVRSCCNCCSFNISWCSSKGVVVGSSALFWLEVFPLELQTSEWCVHGIIKCNAVLSATLKTFSLHGLWSRINRMSNYR